MTKESREKEFSDATVSLDQLFTQACSNATTFSFTRQEASKESFERNIKETEKTYIRLRELSQGGAEELKTLEKMKQVEDLMFRQLRALVDTTGEGESAIEIMKIPGMRQQMQGMLRQFDTLKNDLRTQHQKQQAANPHTSRDTRATIKTLVLLFVVALGGISAALAWFFSKVIAKRLEIVMNNSTLLAANSPLHPVLRGRDEIARLDLEFHKMASALKEASLRERALIDNAVDVICSIDTSNRFTEVNPASEGLWGYSPAKLLGSRIVEIIHNQDVSKTLAVFENCASTQADAELENRVKKKDGSYTHSLWSLKWVAQNKMFFCVVHDINDRKIAEELVKENEARLQMMVECLPVALFLSSPDGTIETANIRAEQMFGYSDGMIGTNIAELFKTATGKKDRIVGTINDDLIGKISELESVRKDGSVFSSEISVNSYVFGDSRKLLTVALDVTERHEIEKFKRDLMAMVSHDLRSPLTSVQGLLSMLEEGVYGKLTDGGKQSVKRSQTDLERLLSLIDELLDIEKMQAGKLQLNFEVVDLRLVMTHAANAINHLSDKKEIRIHIPEHSLEAFGDGAKLVQVVVNLLSNAIKFSPEQSTISIAYKEDNDCVEVRITDEGRGIPPSHIDSIFHKFQQVEAADHHEKGGKGLGLAICQSIIEGHGGTIGVESQEGKGSTFWFRIPQPQ